MECPLSFILRCEELREFYHLPISLAHERREKEKKRRWCESGARIVLCIFMIPPGIIGQVALEHEAARGANGRKEEEGVEGFWLLAMKGGESEDKHLARRSPKEIQTSVPPCINM